MSRKINLTLVIFLFLSLLILLVLPISPFEGLIQKTFSKPLTSLYRIKIGLPFSGSENAEIAKLKDENRKLQEKMADYEKIKKDNQALRSQFENSDFKSQNLVSAEVVGFAGKYSSPSFLIINKGNADGVKKGAAVISGKNLVGRIEKTSEHFSQIILPTNENFSILGKDASTGAVGVIKGAGDFILLDNVVITDNLQKDDMILTKGELDNSGVGIPSDIIVGKINSINKTENKPFQNAKIESLIDYSKLEIVFVITN